MTFRGAIFDFDGVVVDTTPLHYLAWKKLSEKYECKFDFTFYDEIINGRKSSDAITDLLPHLSDQECKEALDSKQNYYHELIEQGKLKVFSSTVKLIEELREHGVRIAAASSSRSVSYVLHKSNILHLFDAVISGHDTRLGKPHPESFLKAVHLLRLKSEECIVFEDAKVGVDAAKAGGFICVGIDRNQKPHHYKLANICVNDLADINYAKLKELFL